MEGQMSKPVRGTRKSLGLEPGTEIIFFGRGDKPDPEGYWARLEVDEYGQPKVIDLEGDRHPRSFGAAGKFWAAPVESQGDPGTPVQEPTEEPEDPARTEFQIRYPYARIVESAGLPGTPEPGWMSQCRHPECGGHRKTGLATELDARDAYVSHQCAATERMCTAVNAGEHVFDGRDVAPEVASEWELCGKPVGDDIHDVEIQVGDFVRRLRVDTLTPTGPELEVVRLDELDDDPPMIRIFWPDAPYSPSGDAGMRWVTAANYRVVRRPEKPVEAPKSAEPMSTAELAQRVRQAAVSARAAGLGHQCAESKGGLRCRLEVGHEGAHRTGDDVSASWEGSEPTAVPCVLGTECADQNHVPGAPLDLASFFVAGKPRPKGSLRPELVRGKNGALKVRMVEQVEEGPVWRKRAAKAAQVAAFGPDARKIPDGWPAVRPVEVSATFVFDRRTASGTSALEEPTDSSRFGDLDKLCRNLGDALTDAHLIRDDGQIVSWQATKRFANDGETEGAYVTVREWV